MSNKLTKLTKRVIDATPHPETGQEFLRDDELRGFAVRITAGAKSFILEKEINGRVRRMTIGRYGELTVEQARKLAVEKMGEIAKGGDPAQDRQQRIRGATFGELAQLYLERHAIHKKSKGNDESLLNHHLAAWRTRKLTDISRADVAKLHAQLGATPSSVIRKGREQEERKAIPTWANRMVALIRTMFNLAQDWGLHPGPNPASRIKFFREVKRDRYVKPDELPRLWKALQSEPNPYVRGAFFVSLLTGARRTEVLVSMFHKPSGAFRTPKRDGRTSYP
jgi:hypothetical protein